MSTFAILPMKPAAEAKSRLEEDVSPSLRAALAEAMFTDVLTALGRSRSLTAVIVVTADEVMARTGEAHGAVIVDDGGAANHSEAAVIGARAAAKAGAARVLMVPGDCPLIDHAEVDALLANPTEDSVVVIPDRHGEGTNALLVSPPESFVPSFGPGSRERHLRLADERGLTASVADVASLALDVDSPEDLAELKVALAGRRGGAAHTRGLLVQADRTGANA